MAKCDYCGVEMSSKILTQYGGYCKLCAEIPNKDKSRFDSPSSSEPKDIYSIWNGWTITGWVLCWLSFMSGDILNWIDVGFIFQQVAFTLSFGFIGIASIIIGISKTILAVMKANNGKAKS